MAHFTMEFGEAIELTGGIVEFANENDTGHSRIIGGAIDLSRYPIFNETYRPRLNGLIIDRFYNQEIGHETVSKFQLQLRAHLNENMPYFNRMYEAEILEIDPLRTVDLQTVTSNTGTQNSVANVAGETDTSTHSGSRSVYSDLPQTMLAGNEDYASNATDANTGASVNAENTETSSAETESTADGDSHTFGYQGNPSELIALYRENLANIDIMVLDSMTPLFMGVWHSGDTATRQDYYYGI